MPNLKDLKVRIGSVKSTQKITKAMQMVAAAKLRRAQEAAEAANPYARSMEKILNSLACKVDMDSAPALLAGNGKDNIHLLVVMSSDRGLCGGFNTSIVKETKRMVASLRNQGKEVKILCAGKKGYEQLKSYYAQDIIDHGPAAADKTISYADADDVARKVMYYFEHGTIDVCSIIYNRFQSAISQIVTTQQIIPLEPSQEDEQVDDNTLHAVYEFEPNEEVILEQLLPKNITVQIFSALLENAASEQGARMTAMDNATRNAGDMIKKLTLVYNRTRQAAITKELIEIISGAEAL